MTTSDLASRLDQPLVLVIEHDDRVAKTLTDSLQAHGYSAVVARSGLEGLADAALNDPDIVILDLDLLDLDGMEVCRALRTALRTPILVVTADGTTERKVAVLDLGADDCVTKPFSMPEMMARVRVALRHRQVLTAVADDRVMGCGPLLVDVGAHQARLGDVELLLTRRQFELLAVLMRNTARVLSHRVLLQTVWGSEQTVATLRTHVNQLRRKLEAHPGAPRIVSEPGVGYRLVVASDQ